MRNLRRSDASLLSARKERKDAVLLTGGTGFVGSHLAVELLARDHLVIILARPKDGMTAQERFDRLLRWHGFPPSANLKVVEGEVARPRLGLDADIYDALLETVGEIWHCACDTRFAEKKRHEVEEVNVQGTANVLQFAEESRCYCFHHMSTAYSLGKVRGVCKEELYLQTDFHNFYERSKHDAEHAVFRRCHRHGIRAAIYRSSIIIGHSRTGRTLIFNGFYHPVRSVDYLRRIVERDLARNCGRNAAKIGARRQADGRLYLPIRLSATENASLNMVPIDFVVHGALALAEQCPAGGIFQLVNPRPTPLREVFDTGQACLRVTGLRMADEREFIDIPRTTLEAKLHEFTEVYDPYMRDERIFDATITEQVLHQCGIACPPVGNCLLARCLDYAIRSNWGSRLFEEFGDAAYEEIAGEI